jgi:hypothetical protein
LLSVLKEEHVELNVQEEFQEEKPNVQEEKLNVQEEKL